MSLIRNYHGKNHISLVTGKLSKSTGMIVKAGEYFNRNAFLTLYYSFVYPYLTYCNHVWGCTYQAKIKQLFILQKKVLRIMFGKRKMDSTEHEEMSLGYLTSCFIAIIMYIINLHGKVNICLLLWRKVISPSSAYGTGYQFKLFRVCVFKIFKIIIYREYILTVMCCATPSVALWPEQKCSSEYSNLHITIRNYTCQPCVVCLHPCLRTMLVLYDLTSAQQIRSP